MLDPPPAIVMPSQEAPPGSVNGEVAEYKSLIRPRSCQSSGSDIVVCGRRDADRYRLRDPLPANPLLMDEIANALTARIGPVEIGFGQFEGARSTGVGLKLKIKF